VPDLSGAAAFVTGGHKGLLGPAGQGFLWTQPMFRSLIGPAGSWLSVVDGSNWARPGTDLDRGWLADGRRLEGGNYNLLGAAVLAESLAMLNRAGVDRIAAHVDALQAMLLERLAGTAWGDEAARLDGLRRAGRLGSILSFDVTPRGPAGSMELVDAGARSGVQASVREGYLRIALHGWHGEPDVERVARWLAAA
jgi:selenocysteine lyase/cysteine desulfurase